MAVTTAPTLARVRARRIAAYLQWIAYLGTFVAFALLREGANHTGIPTAYHYAAAADRFLALGRTPTEWLQLAESWLDWPVIVVWASFFFVPHIAAWKAYRAGTLPRYTRALAVMLGLSAAVHLALPTAPPWLAAPKGAMGPVERVLETRIRGLSPDVYAAGNATAGSNPVAAMPSVHVACVVLAGLVLGWRVWWIVLYGAAMALALAYLGEHFMVDALVGILFAWLGWRVTRRTTARPARQRGPSG